MVVNNIFECNSATSGGGLHARWSDLSVTNNSNFWYNTAVFGGGIFIDNSNLMFNGSCTFRGIMRLTIPAVVYMLQKVFWSFLQKKHCT